MRIFAIAYIVSFDGGSLLINAYEPTCLKGVYHSFFHETPYLHVEGPKWFFKIQLMSLGTFDHSSSRTFGFYFICEQISILFACDS